MALDLNFLKQVTVREITQNDMVDVITLSDIEFGPGYFNENVFKEYFNDEKVQMIAAIHDDKIIGVSVAFTFLKDGLKNDKTLATIADRFGGVEKTGVIKTVMVDRNYQRKGIGTLIVKQSIEFLKSQGAQALYAVAIKVGDIINIGKVLESFNFEKLKVIEDFWAIKSIEWDFMCVECKQMPCICTAVIYTLHPLDNFTDPLPDLNR